LRQLIRQSEQGQRPAVVPGLRWRRGSYGIKFLDEGGSGITYQTIANDLRSIADDLDGVARLDRRDLERHGG